MLGQHDGQYPDSYPLPCCPQATRTNSANFANHRDPCIASNWLYFPGHTIYDGKDTIFMASPPTVVGERDRQRIMLYCDGTAAIIREKAYQEQLARQTPPP